MFFLLFAKSEQLCSWEHKIQRTVKEDEHEGACLCTNVKVPSGERASVSDWSLLLRVFYAF